MKNSRCLNLCLSMVLMVCNFMIHASNEPDKPWFTQMEDAIDEDNSSAVQKLLYSESVDINAIDPDSKRTFLIGATEKNSVQCVKLLLACGADIHYQNKHGRIALMCAAKYNSKESLQLLLTADADLNHQDKYGNTALMLAVGIGSYKPKYMHFKLIDLLVKYGADNTILKGKYKANITIYRKFKSDGSIKVSYSI